MKACESLTGLGMQAYAGQVALERKLSMLETQQKEVHDALVGMEAEALRLYTVRWYPWSGW